MIQLMIDQFRDKRIPLNGTEEEWYDVANHFTHIYRVTEENSLGVPESKWERFDDDHFVHAILYWLVGMSKFGAQDGKVFINTISYYPESPEIMPDQTIPATDPKKIFSFDYPEKLSDWRDDE